MRQTKARRTVTVLAMTVFLVLSDIAPAAAVAPDTTLGTTFIDHQYLNQRSYDYNMSAIYATYNTTLYSWWCGGGTNPYNPTYVADAIYFASYNFTTQAAVGPTAVLGSGPPGAWDHYLACNPSVVGGAFSPFGDGVYYAFAMYYVAVPNVVQFGGAYNRIGVAFSQDGINWRKYHDPIVGHAQPVQGVCASDYGIGSPSAVSTDALGGVRLFYHDACDFTMWSRYSTDGIHFGPATQVTRTGMGICQSPGTPVLSGLPTTANFAFESATSTWYLTADLGCDNNQRPGERGTIGFTMFRMPGGLTNALNAGSWEQVLRVDTNMTGAENNSFPALLRNYYGGLDLPGISPAKIIYFTASNPRVPANATVAQGLAHADPTGYWDISTVTWNPNASHLAELRRFRGSTHNITTGYRDASFFPVTEPSLGWLYNAPQPAIGATRAIYNCHIPGTANYFNSTEPLCEGQRVVGLNGYAFPTGGGTRLPLYRCQAPGTHFVSNQPNCEGQINEGTLGFAAGSATG